MRSVILYLYAVPVLLRAVSLPPFFEPAPNGGYLMWAGTQTACVNSNGILGSENIEFMHANPRAKAEPLDRQPGISSYFIGNDPKKWRTSVAHYSRVRYREIYSGIDVIYYTHDGRLEYDFEIASGADVSQIEMAFDVPPQIKEDGDIVAGNLRLVNPRVFQGRREVQAHYRLSGANQVKITLGTHDDAEPLLVDPVLEYSTYLGGPAYETGNGIKVDVAGNVYITGTARSSAAPGLNPFQQPSGLSQQALIVKFSPSKNAVLYFATVGGTVGGSYGSDIAVDRQGSAYFTGSTAALDFPTTKGAQDIYGGGFFDSFVAKLSPDGTKLLYATYLGGSSVEYGYGIAIDSNGSAYVVGQTYSSNFPTTNALFGSPGAPSGYVAKLSSDGTKLLYATYLGGSVGGSLSGIAVDSVGSAYVVGFTNSADFPTRNPLLAHPPNAALSAGTVTKLAADGQSLIYSTYLGGSQGSGAYSIAVDASGNAFVDGTTPSTDFPTKNPLQPTYGGGLRDAFILKLSFDGSQLLYSTYLGGSGQDDPGRIAIDNSGSLYVAGTTRSRDFPTKHSLQPYMGGGSFGTDAFIAKVSPTGSILIYSTYLGGSADDEAAALAVDANGATYVTGWTDSPDFPTRNPFQETFGGGFADIFIAQLSPEDLPGTPSSLLLSSSVLSFGATVGGGVPPPPQTVTVSAPSAVSFVTTTSASWISVSPANSITPGQLTVSVNSTTLSPGPYSASIIVTPSDSSAPASIAVTFTILAPAAVLNSVSPSSVPVGTAGATLVFSGSGFVPGCVINENGVAVLTQFVDTNTLQFVADNTWFTQPRSYSFTVTNPGSVVSNAVMLTVGTPPPQIVQGGVVNAASFSGNAVAPGELVTIFGAAMGPATLTGLVLDASGLVSTQLAGVQVLFDSIAAPLIYVSATQISAVVPYEVATEPSTQLVVRYQGQSSFPMALPVVPSAPALFTLDSSGRGLVASVESGGDIVVLYGTGAGQTAPPGVDGQPAAAPYATPLLPVSVTIDGIDAEILYAGAAPSLVSGVIQYNVKIPQGLPSGAASIVVTVGNATSPAGTTVAIR